MSDTINLLEFFCVKFIITVEVPIFIKVQFLCHCVILHYIGWHDSNFKIFHVFSQPTITTTNIETLLVATEKEEKITPPPEHIQDKVAFIFNNLAQVNLPQKVSILISLSSESYVGRWIVLLRK